MVIFSSTLAEDLVKIYYVVGTMATDEQVHKVSLKVLVDKEKNKVLFAEARKDFVDALFEFLNNAFGDYY